MKCKTHYFRKGAYLIIWRLTTGVPWTLFFYRQNIFASFSDASFFLLSRILTISSALFWVLFGFWALGKQWAELNVGLHYLLTENELKSSKLRPDELWGSASSHSYHLQKPGVVERHSLCSQTELESLLALSLACWMIFRSHLTSLNPSEFSLVNGNNICGGPWKCTSQIACCGEQSWEKAPTAMFWNPSPDLCRGHASQRLLPTHDWARQGY